MGCPSRVCFRAATVLFYINDIPDGITSRIRLFADDSVLYRKIKKMNRIALNCRLTLPELCNGVISGKCNLM